MKSHLVATEHTQGVMDALASAPWYANLGAAAAFGVAAYVLREVDKKREEDSDLLELVILILALAGLFLAYRGIFGDH